jgi:hypothetical protein
MYYLILILYFKSIVVYLLFNGHKFVLVLVLLLKISNSFQISIILMITTITICKINLFILKKTLFLCKTLKEILISFRIMFLLIFFPIFINKLSQFRNPYSLTLWLHQILNILSNLPPDLSVKFVQDILLLY